MADKRISLIGIIVSDRASTTQLNSLLHEYGDYIVGRMGIPYKDRGINVISLVVDAEPDIISSLSGKIGQLPHISTKTIYPPLPKK